MTTSNQSTYDSESHVIHCVGSWNLAHITLLESWLNEIKCPKDVTCSIDGSKIEKLDSAGALLLSRWAHQQEKRGAKVKFIHFSEEKSELLKIVDAKLKEESTQKTPPIEKIFFVKRTGILVWHFLIETARYLNFIGYLTFEALRNAYRPDRWRGSAVANVIYKNGLEALPIIALLSFMIGVVITYQMGLQLRNYGANIYIVDLLGLAVLREFGPLLTAIMVAGRTGSSFTAQLGMMKLNQEIDALNTMGVTPAELLILPRIMGMVIVLPLLTIWADIFGVLGGMVITNNMLQISWYDFLQRFPKVIPLRALIIGLGKAPVFALILSSVGCYEGMRVEESAESVGKNTTRSVVLAIFFIIVTDAIFSVIFSKLKL